MTYFSKYPQYQYDLQDTQTRKLITDIVRRVQMKANVKANTQVFDTYTVKEG